jgi:Ax21 family sulfation-dependent quorum factor
MKRTVLALALLALPFAASHAGDLSYSWVEADYLHLSQDHFDSTHGFGLRGSGALSDSFNVIAGWSKINGPEVARVRFDDQKTWYAGVGFHTPVATNTDLFAELAYNKLSDNGSHDGYSGRVGVRAALAPNFEGGVAIARTKLDNFEGNTALNLFGQYKITPTFGISAEYSLGNNDKSFLIGPRLSF